MNEPRITHVYSFANGMTMVFDQYGKQMPEFQGRTEEVAGKIKAAGFTMPTEIHHWRADDNDDGARSPKWDGYS